MVAQSALLVTLLTVLCFPAAAEPVLEVFQLHSRPAEEMIPIVRPLAGPDASVTGSGYTLFVKTEPGYLHDVRRALQELDLPLRNLLITVRQVGESRFGDRAYGAPGIAATGGEGQASFDAQRLTTRSRDRNIYQVRTLEGREALVNVGQLVPYRTREFFWRGADGGFGSTVDFQPVSSGFFVVAHLRGETVELQISPRQQRLARDGSGRIEGSTVQTVVSGRLGEWIDLGAAYQGPDTDDNALPGDVMRTERDDSLFQVMVELLP